MLVAPEKKEIVGQLPGERQVMRLDETALAHLQSLLGKGIYNDPELAVVREYACNARDANDEAGNTDPIRVELPNTLSPFLRIIDQGVGLNWDDIVNIYSKYGASTKRVEGNVQTGSLGIGAKSGLAYADQFTVTGTKDGVRTIVSVSANEEGIGEMVRVAEEETDEPNGVEISIPAKRWHTFREKCNGLFRFWPKGSVLVNGEEIEHFSAHHSVQKISDTVFMQKQDYGQSYVVMANVPYPVSGDVFGINLAHGSQLIAYVDVDAVDFAGSREALRMTKKTKDTLAAIGQAFKRELHTTIQADIDSAPDAVEALRKATKWYLNTPEGMRPTGWTYQGQEIPSKFAIGQPDEDGNTPYMIVVRRSSNKLNAHSRERTVPFTTAVDAIWFTGYNLKFTSGHRRRINEWSYQTGMSAEHFILVYQAPDGTYLDPNKVRPWDEVRQTKMPREERAQNGRLLGSYDVLTHSDYETQTLAENIDDAEPIYYFIGEANNNKRWEPSRRALAAPYHRLLRTVESGCSTILIPATREAKLLRTFPEAQRVQDAVKGLYQEWLDGLCEDDKTALHVYESHQDSWRRLKDLDSSQIDDPDLRTAIALTDTPIHTQKLSEQLHAYQAVERKQHHKAITFSADWDNPLENYPLYTNFAPVDDHLYMYLNAAYAARQVEATIAQLKKAA